MFISCSLFNVSVDMIVVVLIGGIFSIVVILLLSSIILLVWKATVDSGVAATAGYRKSSYVLIAIVSCIGVLCRCNGSSNSIGPWEVLSDEASQPSVASSLPTYVLHAMGPVDTTIDGSP